MSLKKIVFNWGPAILLMLGIFFLSSRQRVSVADSFTINFIFFKSLHVIEYATLFFLVFRAMYKTFSNLELSKILFLSVIICVAYAISDEVHQTFVPTRNGTIIDVFIDTIGILIAKYYTEKYIQVIKKYI
jgi:VanZ family protein